MKNVKIDQALPKCFNPNTFAYPLCMGASSPQEIAENDCYTCCLYEDYEGDDPRYD